jgi:hypothetical protein
MSNTNGCFGGSRTSGFYPGQPHTVNVIEKVVMVRTNDYTKNISNFIFTPGLTDTPQKNNSKKYNHHSSSKKQTPDKRS